MNYPNGRKYRNKKSDLIQDKKKKSKYNNQIVVVEGIKFDSKKEAQRYLDLRLLEKSGEITNLALQIPYTLIDKSKYGRKIVYLADFVYYSPKDRKTIVEDVKGYKTQIYKMKKRLLAEKYGIVIKET